MDKCCCLKCFLCRDVATRDVRKRRELYKEHDHVLAVHGGAALSCTCAEIEWMGEDGVAVNGKACTPGSPCREYHKNVRKTVRSFFCPGPRLHDMECTECDPATNLPVPGLLGEKKIPFAPGYRRCYKGDCPECGIGKSVIFKGIPKHTVAFAGSPSTVYACECEMGDTATEWVNFQRLPLEAKPDKEDDECVL